MYSKYYSAKMNRALREREKEVWKYGSWEVWKREEWRLGCREVMEYKVGRFGFRVSKFGSQESGNLRV
jgi:hypothetical protein